MPVKGRRGDMGIEATILEGVEVGSATMARLYLGDKTEDVCGQLGKNRELTLSKRTHHHWQVSQYKQQYSKHRPRAMSLKGLSRLASIEGLSGIRGA